LKLRSTRTSPDSHLPCPQPESQPHETPPQQSTNPQRVAYVYKAKREINGSRVRVIWGRISRPHGNSGVVKGKFTSNLPAKVFGASCRIMLFPSTI
jgi:ribosomal protein L35AE/L33A